MAPRARTLLTVLATFTVVVAGLAFVPSAVAAGSSAKVECTITGTSGDDVLVGTPGHDVICGLGGNDVIRGLGGDDDLYGGAGRDRLLGGTGSDYLSGGDGRDVIRGGPGADLTAGPGPEAPIWLSVRVSLPAGSTITWSPEKPLAQCGIEQQTWTDKVDDARQTLFQHRMFVFAGSCANADYSWKGEITKPNGDVTVVGAGAQIGYFPNSAKAPVFRHVSGGCGVRSGHDATCDAATDGMFLNVQISPGS